MKIWLDDERTAPEGWFRATTIRHVLFKLLAHQAAGWNPIDELSLDHDLGVGQPNGYDLLYCMARLGLKVPMITVHSQNPQGKADMEAFIERMELEG